MQSAVQEAVFAVLGDLYMVFGAPHFIAGALVPLDPAPSDAALRRLWAHTEDVLDQQVLHVNCKPHFSISQRAQMRAVSCLTRLGASPGVLSWRLLHGVCVCDASDRPGHLRLSWTGCHSACAQVSTRESQDEESIEQAQVRRH